MGQRGLGIDPAPAQPRVSRGQGPAVVVRHDVPGPEALERALDRGDVRGRAIAVVGRHAELVPELVQDDGEGVGIAVALVDEARRGKEEVSVGGVDGERPGTLHPAARLLVRHHDDAVVLSERRADLVGVGAVGLERPPRGVLDEPERLEVRVEVAVDVVVGGGMGRLPAVVRRVFVGVDRTRCLVWTQLRQRRAQVHRDHEHLLGADRRRAGPCRSRAHLMQHRLRYR